MIKTKLTLLNNVDNILSEPQTYSESYKIDSEKFEQFYDGVKLFSKRAKSHLTFKYVDFHIQNNFKFLDIVTIPKYPLLAVYNKETKKCLINLSATTKTRPENIDPRDLYTMIVYGHCCSVLSNVEVDEKYSEVFCEYMALLFLKIFSKKYGITGSYIELIPQFKFIISLYVLVSFFGMDMDSAKKKASALAKFDHRKINVDWNEYDMSNPTYMIRLLSVTGVCNGLNTYKFVETMIKYFGPMNLAIFDDLMRFSSVMFSSTINSNTFFSPLFQIAYSQQKFFKINEIIEHYLS